MKNKIKEILKTSRLKTWKAFAEIVGQDKSNFQRRMFQNIDRINTWLKHIGLELCVKEIDIDNEAIRNELHT